MQQADEAAFKQLFRDACRRCFGRDLTVPLSAAESKLFCARVLEETAGVIGWKTVQNYSLHIHLEVADDNRHMHPTSATLETLARYVLWAPRADGGDAAFTPQVPEGGHPYWFRYKQDFQRLLPARIRKDNPPLRKGATELPEGPVVPRGLAQRFFFHTFRAAEQFLIWSKLLVPEQIRHSWLAWLAFVLFSGLVVVWSVREYYYRKTSRFTDAFAQVEGDSLYSRGWIRHYPDSTWWARRDDEKGALTLFTLEGNNWPDTTHAAKISNLLIRPIPGECFTAEIQFADFMPTGNWQQAGILLMEDTSLHSRSVRISIAYNDYFEDYVQPRQIIVEGVSSAANPNGKPEEIVHKTLYLLGWGKDSLIRESMRHTALRIEKRGNAYRFLYAGGQNDNFTFQEVGSRNLYITPRYIAIFALKGYGTGADELPVAVKYFSLEIGPCEP
jgi:hypothetical protein